MTRPRPACRPSRAAVAFVLAAFAVAPVAAAPAVKDGMPCIDAVCVGDDATALHHVAWEPAVDATGAALSDTRVPGARLERLRAVLRGHDEAVEALAPYWLLRRLDNAGLAPLARIHAVCEPLGVADRLQATYLDGEGRSTVVSFEPVAEAPGATPRFVVASIVQHIVEDDPARLEAIGRAIAARYAGVPAYASATRPGAAWVPTAAAGPQLRLIAPFGDPVERAANLRLHPDCGEPAQPLSAE
jgi:hypothetical protein